MSPANEPQSRSFPARNLRGELARLASLALPVVITQVGFMLFGVVDLMMVGHLGEAAIAATSLGNTWTTGTLLVGIGIVYGMDPIITRAHGAGDGARAGLALQRGVILALLVSVPVSLSWSATEGALILLGQDPELAALAQRYVSVQIPSAPCFLVFTALRQYLQGRAITLPALVVVSAANGINAFANWVIVYGNLGAPALGVVGSGIATSITRGSMLFALAAWIAFGRLSAGAWVPWSRASFARAGLLECLGHGLPVALMMGLEVWAFQIATIMSGWLGATELAAHGVALNLASLAFMVPLGISFGATTRVGNLLGAGDPGGAQRAAWAAFALGAGAMALFALAFVALRDVLPTCYTSEPGVLAAAAAILPIAGAFQVFDGVQVVGCGILRGMGRTRPVALFNLIGYYALALPMGWWLAFRTDAGLAGIWWGLALGLAFVALVLVAWIRVRGPASETPLDATRFGTS